MCHPFVRKLCSRQAGGVVLCFRTLNVDLVKPLAILADKSPELLLFGLGLILAWFAGQSRLGERLFGAIPISHKIAVIGLPGAGKTSLITAMFEVIVRGRIKPDIRVHGEKTITLINRYIARLASGQIIGPTTEHDVFVFRFSYIKKRLFQKLYYDIEIADFPGEFSERIEHSGRNSTRSRKSNEFEDEIFAETLFNREFFSWIASSSEYLFVVDLSDIYSAEGPNVAIQQITARIRNSWQIIEHAVSDRGLGRPKGRKIHLVFSKLDSLSPLIRGARNDAYLEKNAGEVSAEIEQRGNCADLTSITDVSMPSRLLNLREAIEQEFADLIQFFKARTHRLTIIYTSLILRDENEQRLGIAELLDSVLP